MNNKEIQMHLRMAASQEALIKAISSGKVAAEIKKETEALAAQQTSLTKALGGKKALDNAINMAKNIAEKAREEGLNILSNAQKSIDASLRAMDEREKQVVGLATANAVKADSLKAKATELDVASAALQAREKALDERESAISIEANAIATRGAHLGRRELEIEEQEKWLASRPG